MADVTRRQLIRASVIAGTAVATAVVSAAPEDTKTLSLEELLLPAKLTLEYAQTHSDEFTKLEYTASSFWVRCVGIGDGVPHTLIGVYAPDEGGVLRRSLFAQSWAAGKIEATVNAMTGMLELHEVASSDLKWQLVLSCNLKTIGTRQSILAR